MELAQELILYWCERGDSKVKLNSVPRMVFQRDKNIQTYNGDLIACYKKKLSKANYNQVRRESKHRSEQVKVQGSLFVLGLKPELQSFKVRRFLRLKTYSFLHRFHYTSQIEMHSKSYIAIISTIAQFAILSSHSS